MADHDPTTSRTCHQNRFSNHWQVEALDVICTLFMVQKNIPEAEKSAAEMLRMAKLNESLIDLEIAALVQMVQVGSEKKQIDAGLVHLNGLIFTGKS
jgi:hypothetical protein